MSSEMRHSDDHPVGELVVNRLQIGKQGGMILSDADKNISSLMRKLKLTINRNLVASRGTCSQRIS